MPAQTLAQKIIAHAAGRDQVRVGEIVTCQVDLAMFHDSSGPRRLQPMLEELGAKIWNKNKVVLVMDHYVHQADPDAQKIVRIARDWAREQALPHVHDSQGICHVVLPQKGHLKPGMLCVGGDSHSPTGGALGCYMFGIGATEMLGVVVRGSIWLQVPQTLLMHWQGRLQRGVMAKDMMLHMLGRLGMNGGRYQAVEFAGDAVRALSMQERMTLCNMGAELGAQAALVAPDVVTQTWLQSVGVQLTDDALAHWHTDDAAETERLGFDASTLAPQIAAPHSPANVQEVSELAQHKIDIAYIGACTGAKLDDLRIAAQVLKGHRIAQGIELLVAPASLHDVAAAEQEGVMQILRDAGAKMLPSACGACAGYGGSVAEGSTVISSTARNFKGRMGPASAQVYLGSPATVAACALRGCITDPREVMA